MLFEIDRAGGRHTEETAIKKVRKAPDPLHPEFKTRKGGEALRGSCPPGSDGILVPHGDWRRDISRLPRLRILARGQIKVTY